MTDCTCGHPMSAHYSEYDDTQMSGLFGNYVSPAPELAVYLYCAGTRDQACSVMGHSIV